MTKSFALISLFALSTLSSAVLGRYVTTGEQEAIPPINTEGHRKLQVSNTQGPWPECLQMTGEECKNYIESQDPDLVGNVKLAYPRKFNYYRIWINVDENGVVTEAPGRG